MELRRSVFPCLPGGLSARAALRAACAWVAALCVLGAPLAAQAVPKADHVRIEIAALRLTVNDYCTRHQVKVLVTVSSSDDAGLAGVKDAEMTLTNPTGKAVSFTPRNVEISPKRFKAATAKLVFKAGEDSASAALSNVPTGFFVKDGTYKIGVRVRGVWHQGEFVFGEPVALKAEQDGQPVEHFSLKDEAAVKIYTTPDSFGPVYYKRQDVTNFMFMLNNMEQAIQSGDYHPEYESPMYIFQVSIGDASGGPARLLDPSRYIEGHQEFLIRSDHTTTPVQFSADEFNPGQVVVVDFIRQDTLPPDAGFIAPADGFSGQITVQNRAVYAMAVETAPSGAELGNLPAVPDKDE